jgi:hypothetical protein
MEKYVTSEDVLFVEKKIKTSKKDLTPSQLWKSLRGHFRTKAELGTILKYFENEKMIILDDEKKIVWIKNPYLMNLLQTRGFVVL